MLFIISEKISTEELRRVIDSISDNESFLEFNVTPVQKIISILQDSFDPNKPQDHFSLSLAGSGRTTKKILSSFSSFYSGYSSSYMGGGACLSHDHATQFAFVLQSFTLWQEIMTNMPRLWLLADLDMTTEQYRLVDTGQGINYYQYLFFSLPLLPDMQKYYT
jgi:hypothetical protein